jgi:hypothetical protein
MKEAKLCLAHPFPFLSLLLLLPSTRTLDPGSRYALHT